MKDSERVEQLEDFACELWSAVENDTIKEDFFKLRASFRRVVQRCNEVKHESN